MGLYGIAEILVLAEEGVRRTSIARVALREAEEEIGLPRSARSTTRRPAADSVRGK